MEGRMGPKLLRTLLAAFLAVLFTVTSAQPATKYKILHGFGKGKDGGGIFFAGVALDREGNVYGVTQGGGAYGFGMVFELTPGPRGKWTETILHNFCRHPPHCMDGSSPSATPALDAQGDLYGTAVGATFQMTPRPKGRAFKVIWGRDGGDLILDAKGNLYGGFTLGKYDSGAVGELSPTPHGWKEKDLYSFCRVPGCPDGVEGEGPLAWDAAGNLYGVTQQGGKYNGGLVFQLEHVGDKWKDHVLHNFVDGDPLGGVVLDAAGNVYGSTSQGGKYYNGDVFMLSPQKDGTWKYTELYDFPDYMKNGAGPIGQMVFDKAGNLYGATSGGGKYGLGTVFELSPASGGKWTHRVLHAFQFEDGEIPYAGLTIDGQGNLYGTTSEGGPNNYGVVYQITP